ncbi:MAG: M24 family metallopeptidase [Deltaproteobacteria bacterium]|jgi:Xaa-Pro aminopeptidase
MAKEDTNERLKAVRRQMDRMGVDVAIVRSTDRYLNEYVPTDESARVWISAFTGSMGEVVVTKSDAYLAVDGRYWIQAKKEIDLACFTIIEVQLGSGIDGAIAELIQQLAEKAGPKKKLRIGYEPERVTPNVLKRLQAAVGEGVTWKPTFPSPVEQARGANRPAPREAKIRAVDEKRVGRTVGEKLDALGARMETLGVEAVLVQRLDEIAYLSNLRGDELPYQATFKAIALATQDNLFIGMDPSKAPKSVRVARDRILFVPESEFWTLMGKKAKRSRIAYDPDGNSEWGRQQIESTGAEAIALPSPIQQMKARKNPAELKAMQDAFARADGVVEAAIQWVCSEVVAGKKVSEKDFANKVQELFFAREATGLSFKIISAAGKNGAIIHYSDPSARRALKRGELMLLDTGAYFAEGYATDLTRTFLVDDKKAKGNAEQRRLYTLVLKAAVAGMRATFPRGTTGAALDAIVRAPLWAEGLNYNHGTGHGVGINVHEFPPRIAPGTNVALEEGHVFSIEPGVYLPKFGGIRIENLCTVEAVPKSNDFLRVKPLTFSPLDKRLIETKMLSADEKAWLGAYAKRANGR